MGVAAGILMLFVEVWLIVIRGSRTEKAARRPQQSSIFQREYFGMCCLYPWCTDSERDGEGRWLCFCGCILVGRQADDDAVSVMVASGGWETLCWLSGRCRVILAHSSMCVWIDALSGKMKTVQEFQPTTKKKPSPGATAAAVTAAAVDENATTADTAAGTGHAKTE